VLEVDSNGNTIRELSYEQPVAGHDVVLSIDHRVQAVTETALREELERSRNRRVTRGNPSNTSPAGSAVVLDPVDGAVVAMASYPDYDPAAFTDGIDDAEWAALNDPASFYPLINRAIEGQYAPGSTFKLITAYAGLTTGFIAPTTTWADGGVYRVPNCRGDSCIFRNAGSRAYGRVDLREALTVSSDTYFYDIGARLWFGRDQHPNAIQDAAELFGMGADSGVPLPNEKGGRIMTPEEFAARHEEHPDAFPDGDWQAGDNINMAIGQGEVLVTPIQLANAYATLANGGTLHAPNIALRVVHSGTQDVVRSYEPRVVRAVSLPEDWRAALVDGFTGVVAAGGGTAHSTFSGFPEGWPVAGKTGTAEVSLKADTAVFVGMGPMPIPRYVAATFMEESGFGGVAAAPLVRRVFEPIAAGEAAMPQVLRCPASPVSGVPADTGCPPEAAAFGYSLSIPLEQSADPLAEGDVLD
jgi:penicillin-binding protein 2